MKIWSWVSLSIYKDIEGEWFNTGVGLENKKTLLEKSLVHSLFYSSYGDFGPVT